MSSPSGSAVLPSRDSGPSVRRVLFAISPEEWRLFFPNQIDLSGFEITRFPGDAATFEGALIEHRPDVLVTAWSTPLLREEWLDGLPDLRFICHTCGSVRHVVPRAFLERGGTVTNWGAIASKTVAEHGLLLILAGLRRMDVWPSVISGERPWHRSSMFTRTLYGKRVGIHGFGNVARALVELLRPFGVAVSACSEGVPPELFVRCGVARRESLEDLFAGSDILVECEALTPRTQGSVTGTLLRRLPRGAVFVNVGRGAVVDEVALAELAFDGHLRLALDVFATEPIAPDSPLHDVGGTILSPHIAGPTSDQLERCGELVERNLHAFFDDRPLEAVVTLEMFDRST